MMTIKVFKPLLLTTMFAMMAGLAGCASSDGDSDIPGLTGGGGGSGGTPAGESSCRIDGTALCAIPEVGPAIVEGAGGLCPDDAGQLTPLQLCAVPGVGVPLAEAICGVSCPDTGGGGGEEPPLDIAQLCAIPQLGPAIVEGAGGTCGGVPPPDGGGGQCLPNQCDPTGNGCLSDIPGFSALVCP